MRSRSILLSVLAMAAMNNPGIEVHEPKTRRRPPLQAKPWEDEARLRAAEAKRERKREKRRKS